MRDLVTLSPQWNIFMKPFCSGIVHLFGRVVRAQMDGWMAQRNSFLEKQNRGTQELTENVTTGTGPAQIHASLCLEVVRIIGYNLTSLVRNLSPIVNCLQRRN